MDASKLTGLDLLMFLSAGLMTIKAGEDGISLFVEDALAEMLTDQTGIDISTELLAEVLQHFIEFSHSATYSLKENVQ